MWNKRTQPGGGGADEDPEKSTVTAQSADRCVCWASWERDTPTPWEDSCQNTKVCSSTFPSSSTAYMLWCDSSRSEACFPLEICFPQEYLPASHTSERRVLGEHKHEQWSWGKRVQLMAPLTVWFPVNAACQSGVKPWPQPP